MDEGSRVDEARKEDGSGGNGGMVQAVMGDGCGWRRRKRLGVGIQTG